MQLAAWELGVGSCIASMWEPDKAKAILGVPADHTFTNALSFGYPATPAAAPPRKGGRLRWRTSCAGSVGRPSRRKEDAAWHARNGTAPAAWAAC